MGDANEKQDFKCVHINNNITDDKFSSYGDL